MNNKFAEVHWLIFTTDYRFKSISYYLTFYKNKFSISFHNYMGYCFIIWFVYIMVFNRLVKKEKENSNEIYPITENICIKDDHDTDSENQTTILV